VFICLSWRPAWLQRCEARGVGQSLGSAVKMEMTSSPLQSWVYVMKSQRAITINAFHRFVWNTSYFGLSKGYVDIVTLIVQC